MLTAVLLACGGPDQDGAVPTLTTRSPTADATSVVLNARLSVTFDTAMEPLTSSSFLLKQGGSDVAGTVATTADGATATFKPTANLAAGTVYTATITKGARSTEGVALAADSTWSFTTGTSGDTSAPV